MIEFINHHNPNTSRVKRGSASIVRVERLTEFLHGNRETLFKLWPCRTREQVNLAGVLQLELRLAFSG